jgi:hypothetical protein
MVSFGDYRQLADATFNAGLNSGSQFEYVDTANSLHFYVINVHKDAQGILSYTVGVRSLAGSGPLTRALTVDNDSKKIVDVTKNCSFRVKNKGQVGTVASGHPEDVTAYENNDVFRLSASVTGTGWTAQISNALASVKAGSAISVPVRVRRTAGSSESATVTLTATSESDPSKSATGTCPVQAA